MHTASLDPATPARKNIGALATKSRNRVSILAPVWKLARDNYVAWCLYNGIPPDVEAVPKGKVPKVSTQLNTPFMTRHDHVYGYMNNMKPSGCQEYHTAMKKTTWMSMSRQLNSAAHGHIHETMGGSWNHYFAERNSHNTAPAILTFAHEIQALSKELWRAGFVQCPDTCSMDTPWKECQCLCAADALEGLEPYDVLDQSGVLKSVEFYDHENHLISSWYDENGTLYYTLPDYSEEESKHIYGELLEMLCSPGHIGDMFQATSSNDVTFWVLHGTLDRLWHFKRLGSTENYDETWDPYHTCYGHNPTNFQPFKNLFNKYVLTSTMNIRR